MKWVLSFESKRQIWLLNDDYLFDKVGALFTYLFAAKLHSENEHQNQLEKQFQETKIICLSSLLT